MNIAVQCVIDNTKCEVVNSQSPTISKNIKQRKTLNYFLAKYD